MVRHTRPSRSKGCITLIAAVGVLTAALLSGASAEGQRPGYTGVADNAVSRPADVSPSAPDSAASTATAGAPPLLSSEPPSADGYFSLQPVRSWAALPDNNTCASRVHRSTWEPRPDNTKRNHVMPDPQAVHQSFAARPISNDRSHDQRWDSWLLQRVDGQFTGTTDEIFQWAACKWGLSDNMVRASAVRESTWYQYETYPSGRPVLEFGGGDMLTPGTGGADVYCDSVAQHGYDYQRDFGPRICPQTFSIVGVKSWQSPDWGAMPGNQNGTFPFNRDSTAFAVDYLASQLRGCYEGWQFWLRETGTKGYAAGDIWGCVGAWYAGEWHSPAASEYISLVQHEFDNRTWLTPGWPSIKPAGRRGAYSIPRPRSKSGASCLTSPGCST